MLAQYFRCSAPGLSGSLVLLPAVNKQSQGKDAKAQNRKEGLVAFLCAFISFAPLREMLLFLFSQQVIHSPNSHAHFHFVLTLCRIL